MATAFGHTFIWAMVMALLSILPAVALLHADRARRRPGTSGSAERANAEPELPRAAHSPASPA